MICRHRDRQAMAANLTAPFGQPVAPFAAVRSHPSKPENPCGVRVSDTKDVRSSTCPLRELRSERRAVTVAVAANGHVLAPGFHRLDVSAGRMPVLRSKWPFLATSPTPVPDHNKRSAGVFDIPTCRRRHRRAPVRHSLRILTSAHSGECAELLRDPRIGLAHSDIMRLLGTRRSRFRVLVLACPADRSTAPPDGLGGRQDVDLMVRPDAADVVARISLPDRSGPISPNKPSCPTPNGATAARARQPGVRRSTPPPLSGPDSYSCG